MLSMVELEMPNLSSNSRRVIHRAVAKGLGPPPDPFREPLHTTPAK